MVGIYFAIIVICYVLIKEKYIERINSELTANRGKRCSWCRVG